MVRPSEPRLGESYFDTAYAWEWEVRGCGLFETQSTFLRGGNIIPLAVSHRESLRCVKYIFVCVGWGAEIQVVVFMVGFSADSSVSSTSGEDQCREIPRRKRETHK